MSSPRTIIFYLGAQASIRQALEHVRPGGHRTLEVRPEVEAAPDREPQARFAGTAWTGCDSWHRDRHGRIVADWPGYIREYLQRTRRFAAAITCSAQSRGDPPHETGALDPSSSHDRALCPHRSRAATARRPSRARGARPVSLPSLGVGTRAAEPPPRLGRAPRINLAERDRLIRRAKTLSWLSLAYMTAEGAIAVTAALLAGSVALLGFGLDSAIEGAASIIVIWRFTGSRRSSEHAERRAERLVALSFFLLAPYIAQDAIRTLIGGEHPGISWLGIGLSISSIVVMPTLGRAKQGIGLQLGSGATAGEGTQNMLCACLAVGVLAGLALNAAFGWWWADPAVALVIAAVAINEGRETWRGEGCCASMPSPHVGAGTCRDADCCG